MVVAKVEVVRGKGSDWSTDTKLLAYRQPEKTDKAVMCKNKGVSNGTGIIRRTVTERSEFISRGPEIKTELISNKRKKN